MNPIVAIQDGIYAYPENIIKSLSEVGFRDVVSPVDEVTYPDICQPVPPAIKDTFGSAIANMMMQEIHVKEMFGRMMKAGTKAPHMVHEDSSLGQFAAHLYLSKDWPRGSGTEFCTHKEYGPHNGGVQRYLGEDHKTMDSWTPYLFVQAECNRLLIHAGNYYHRALPTEGFGTTVDDSRLVLTCFFDIN